MIPTFMMLNWQVFYRNSLHTNSSSITEIKLDNASPVSPETVFQTPMNNFLTTATGI